MYCAYTEVFVASGFSCAWLDVSSGIRLTFHIFINTIPPLLLISQSYQRYITWLCVICGCALNPIVWDHMDAILTSLSSIHLSPSLVVDQLQRWFTQDLLIRALFCFIDCWKIITSSHRYECTLFISILNPPTIVYQNMSLRFFTSI